MTTFFGRRLILLILIAAVPSTTFSCQALFPESETSFSYTEAFYTINPGTILTSLDRGDTGVFMPQASTPEPTSITLPRLVQWSQTDYLRIAQALHEFVWKESTQDWFLHRLIFRMDCKDVQTGPQSAQVEYFTIRHIREQESRFVSDIFIDPQNNSVSLIKVEYYPKLESWQSIDLKRLTISAKNALDIAEQNGGEKIRLEVENDCVIYETLAPGSPYNGWHVGYSNGGPTGLFDINIDTLTGKYEVVK